MLSCAVMVIELAKPATTPGLLGGYPEMASLTGEFGLTVIVGEAWVMVSVTVSVAVIVCGPAVFKVALKLPVPLASVESVGRPPPDVRCGALDVECTVP